MKNINLENLKEIISNQTEIQEKIKILEFLINDPFGTLDITASEKPSSGSPYVKRHHFGENDIDQKIIFKIAREMKAYYENILNDINTNINDILSKLSEKNTKIISGFPGIGKSHIFRNNTDLVILDSDSSNFSWISKGVRHPEFPQNYMNHIKANIGKVDIIFVSSHDIVRDALRDECIHYTLVYPDRSLKNEYIDRYIARGNDDGFINMITSNWDKFIDGCENERFANTIKLKQGEYLCDALLQLNKED